MKGFMMRLHSSSLSEIVELQNDLLDLLSAQRDLFLTRTALETQPNVREAIALHALNHITK